MNKLRGKSPMTNFTWYVINTFLCDVHFAYQQCQLVVYIGNTS